LHPGYARAGPSRCPFSCGTPATNPYPAHDAVQQPGGTPANIGISSHVVHLPSYVPLPGWDVLWLTRFRALASLTGLLRASQAASKTVTAQGWRKPERGVCHERPGTAAGNR